VISIGLGARASNNSMLARQSCIALQKMIPSSIAQALAGQTGGVITRDTVMANINDHVRGTIFDKLRAVIYNTTHDYNW
jgi:hypothetical protein